MIPNVLEYLWIAETIAASYRRRFEPGSLLKDSEVLADAYVGLMTAARRWSPAAGVPFGAFARTGITIKIIEGLRSRSLKGFRRKQGAPKIHPLRDTASSRSQVDDYENRDLCETLISRCPPNQQTRLRKRFWLGMSQDEIAAEDGVSKQAVHIGMRKCFEVMRA